jgi:hypothetical protein
MPYAINIARAAALVPLLLAAAPLSAQQESLEDMLSLGHAETPDHVASQAGTVLGTARVCEVDTAQFETRVEQLLGHMTGGGTALATAKDDAATAAKKAEHQERSEPSVGCNDFRRLFTEFWINKPGWTPADGWKPL